MMRLEDALREAPNFIRNAQDAATRAPGNPDTLYMWDNQVSAIESFLANTEDLKDQSPELQQTRKQLWDLKKTIQNQVLEFELKQEGEEMPPEPSDEDLVAELSEFGKEIEAWCQELDPATIADVKQVQALEDPRAQLNAFLADSEPLVGKDKELDRLRGVVRSTRNNLEARIQEIVREWRQQDLAAASSED